MSKGKHKPMFTFAVLSLRLIFEFAGIIEFRASSSE